MNKIKQKIKKSLDLASFGKGFTDRFKLFILPFWISLEKKFKFFYNFDLSVNLILNGKFARIKITDSYDYDTLYDVFVNGEYFFGDDFSPKIIFDLGGHVGYTAIYFHLLYPEAMIYVFEPSLDNFNKLKINTANIDKIKTFNIAVAAASGQLPFYHNNKKSTSSSLVARGEEAPSEMVKAKTLDQLMSELGISHIDVLKFDIEGSEYSVFKNSNHLSDINILVGELHPGLIRVKVDDFYELFKGFEVSVDQKTSEKSKFLAKNSRF